MCSCLRCCGTTLCKLARSLCCICDSSEEKYRQMQGLRGVRAPMAPMAAIEEDAEEGVDHAGFTKWLTHVAKEILSRNPPLSKEVREDRRANEAARAFPSDGLPLNYIDGLSHLTDRLLDEENSSGFERVAASLRALFRRSVSSDLELVFQHAPQAPADAHFIHTSHRSRCAAALHACVLSDADSAERRSSSSSCPSSS